MSDVVSGSSGQSKPAAQKSTVGAAGGLRIYKPGQGYYTRVGTALGTGLLIVAGSMFVFTELDRYIDQNAGYALPVKYGFSVAWLLLGGIAMYWVVGLNARTNDFFIATEGEMKKVNWSSRKDIIKSTKVVILWVILLSAFLFIVDIAFILLFSAVGVLEGNILGRLFGAES